MLREAGYGDEEIAALKEAGAVAGPAATDADGVSFLVVSAAAAAAC